MDNSLASNSGMYAQILGTQWSKVAESVRRLHDPRGVHAVGSFRVRGGNRLARFLAWLGRLPTACDAVSLRLTVSPLLTDREQWLRLFGQVPFKTLQWANDGCLVERVSRSETHLKLDAIDGALHYRTRCVALRLGPLRFQLPRWLAPRVTASETQEGAGLRIHVDVVLPIVGLLIAYDGVLTRIETNPW